MKLMPYLKNLICLGLLFNIAAFNGCSKKPPPLVGKSSIEQEFLDSFNKTSKLDYTVYTSTKIVGKTFWIYIATDKDILTLSPVSSMGGVIPEKKIKFLEIKCNYENSVFNLNYIFLKYTAEEKTSEDETTIKVDEGSSLTYNYTKTMFEILEKTYLAIGDIISKVEDMNFFTLCLADIKRGIELIFIIHKLDMEQYLSGMLPFEEFYGRIVPKAKGSKDIINDRYGLHLEYNDISLTGFLREQIVNNATAKINEWERYEPKKIEALDKLDDLLLESIYRVTTKYEFDDYFLVEIENIITKEKLSLSRSKLINRFSSPILD